MTRELHIAKATHNKAFADKVLGLGEEYRDWAITAIFYSALHYVEAMLVDRGRGTISHEKRDREIKDNLPFLRLDYRNLFEKAHDARYQDTTFSDEDVTTCMSRLQRIENRALNPLVSKRPPRKRVS